MAAWQRGTPWRQGHVIDLASLRELGVSVDAPSDNVIAVVISHDCDLAQLPDNEPNVEVIVGRIIQISNGNFTHAKNVRKLHLQFRRNGTPAIVELTATKRVLIPKDKFAAHTLPRSDWQHDQVTMPILQRWLAARYRRAAFPDEFDRRLESSGMKGNLAKILEPSGMHLPAIFFDVDDGIEVVHNGPVDPYVLDVYLLHNTQPDPGLAEAAAIDVKNRIEDAFKRKLFSESAGWQHIELRSCEIYSDEAMSYRLSQTLREWCLEHISLRQDPPQPMLNADD